MQPSSQNKSLTNDLSYCVIIPTYNNANTLKRVIDGVLVYAENASIIKINDRSTDDTPSILKDYNNKIEIINNEVNLGKGISLRKAFKYALEKGIKHAITIDSDGQHYPKDIPLFLEV